MGQVYEMKPKKTKKPVRPKNIVIILLAVYLVYTLSAQYIAISKSRTEEARIQAQIEQMKKENEKLKDEIERMQSDEYIEKIARERLGLIKSGEIMFVDVNHGEQDSDN
ncbi:MAG: septum formation initiator family protein [Bacillota bacterium]|jgi:cell division protein FtsL|nr:septum formation initiator family protein [Bacillota bacterium]MDD3298093.1 septum formation initiator family protein [Bacillota bacterium]MDD3850280.1 septum formation initiator family protein [Bacillota bacterium]MDD4707626.1 septum formation initiator family protein [Bacillota bacterium]